MPVLGIVNSAAMSICVQVFAEYLFSIFRVYTRNGIAGLYGILCLT